MWYKGNSFIDHQKARDKLNQLIFDKKDFEITEKRNKRTYKQNNYLHLILSYFALNYGDSLEYCKLEFFKKTVNLDIFEYERLNEKNGEIRTDYRSTADLDTVDMKICIDRFLTWSARDAGIRLPEPDDLVFLREIEIELQNNKEYL